MNIIQRYDVFLSVGIACRPAHHLLVNGLRREAYPLDWQMNYSLDTVIHLFETKFQDFFIDIIEEDSKPESDTRRIKDIKNDIVSIHHFKKKMDITEAHGLFLKKMKERFFRLENKLKKESKLFMICNRDDCVDDIWNFLNCFSNIYPKAIIKLINIRNYRKLPSSNMYIKNMRLNEKLTYIDYVINDELDLATGEKYDWKGNGLIWGVILKNYCLS